MRRIGIVLCLLIILSSAGGCTARRTQVEVCDGLTLSLPRDFEDLSNASYAKDADFLFGMDTLILMGLSEEKAALTDMTLADYTQLVIQGNGLNCTPEKTDYGYVFSYEAPVKDTVYTYAVATLQCGDHFWILQFYCPSVEYPEHEKMIEEILESVM